MLSSQLILLRKCRDCGLEAYNEKDLEHFVKNKKSYYGHRNYCKKCFNSQLRDPLKYRASRDRANKKWHQINNPKQIKFLEKNTRQNYLMNHILVIVKMLNQIGF